MADANEERLRALAAEAVARGSLIFHLDLAGALAAQAVRAAGLDGADPVLAVDIGPRGYEIDVLSADLDEELGRVTFAADGRALFEQSVGAPQRRARAIAEASRRLQVYAPGERAIVLPPRDEEIEAYLFVQPEHCGDIVIGVHRHLTLSRDGRLILLEEALSQSSLVVPGREGRPAFDIVLTHLLGDTPSEMHVYLSLKHSVPLDVITTSNQEHWQIDGERISLL